jgi:hypothetical protein
LIAVSLPERAFLSQKKASRTAGLYLEDSPTDRCLPL